MRFENIVNQYSNLAYKIAIDMLSSPYDAQDVVQEAYLSLYNHFKEYGKLSEKEIKNVLCRIVLNKCKDYLKSSKRREITVLNDSVDFQADTIDEFFSEDDGRVREAIYQLDSPYKEVLMKYYLEEYTLEEIAIKNKTSKGTIKVQITRGKQKLKEILRKERYFMKKINRIDQLLSDENELENYLASVEEQEICVPQDLKKNIFIKVNNQKKKNYMNICKIAACLIFGLVVCRTEFITQDNFNTYQEREEIESRVEIQEKFSDLCSFLRTPIKQEGKEKI